MKKDVLRGVLLLVFVFLISFVLIIQVQASEDMNGEFVEKIGQDPIVCTAYGTDYPQQPTSTGPLIFLKQSKPLSGLSTRALAGFYLLGSAIFLLIIFLLLRKVRTLDMFVLEYRPRPRRK